jgi:membrane-associated protein
MERTAAHRSQPYAKPTVWVVGTVAATATLLLVVGVIPLPDVDRVLEDGSRTLGGWAYPTIAGFAFLETGAFIGLVVPGETAVVVGGVVAERGGVELIPLIGFVWLAAVGGDVVSFLLGRRLGRPFLERHGERLRLGPERLAHVERFYDHHGGKTILVGRFAGVVRAVSPFLAGASGLALVRFLPWSAAGALLWATTFTLVGYGFSESFAESGESAARIALGAALVVGLAFATTALVRSGRFRRRRQPPGELQGGERTQGAEPGADKRAGHHIEREVHPQVDARQGHRGGDGQGIRAQAGAKDRHGGRGGEGGGAVTRREGRVAWDGGERAEPGVVDGGPGAIHQLLEELNDQRGDTGRSRGRGEGQRQPAAPEVRGEAQSHQQWRLHPPGGEQHEDRREQRMLEGLSGFDERMVEVEQRSHPRSPTEASTADRLLIAVNGRASGITDPQRTGGDLVAGLQELGAPADFVVTRSQEELWEVLRDAAAAGRRVVLVGGDGSVHAAANAPLQRLPELALVPAGRANNVARALGISTARADALAVAAGELAHPMDALRVVTPDRLVYAVEAVSGGFQAEARGGYDAENSADLRQGVRALLRAVRRYRPYRARVELEAGAGLRSADAAQLFLANLPFFGFGFEVDPGADPSDGRLEAILLEARNRRRLVRLLAAARRGRHIGRRGVERVAATRARLVEPLPLVADALPLGTTTATVSVEPARLRVASPSPRGATA